MPRKLTRSRYSRDRKRIWDHVAERFFPVRSDRGKELVAKLTELSINKKKKVEPIPETKAPEIIIPATTEDIVKMMALKGREDLYFFATEICEFGLNDDPEGPKITEDQKEFLDWLQSLSSLIGMGLTPRDTLKSTCLQADALWKLVKKPNARILFYGEVHEQAKKRIAVIKRVIDHAQTFRACYGDLNGGKRNYPWNENMMTLANRSANAAREASIETAGLDVVVNARHFDYIYPDDLHSEANTKTKDQIESVKDKFKLLIPLLSRGGRIIVAGVFWSDDDVHNWLQKEVGAESFIRSCFSDEDDKISRYPYMLPIEALKQKENVMRGDLFALHYRLDPVPKKSQKFQKDHFNILPRLAFRNLRVFLLIDQAGDPTSQRAASKDSDCTGMSVIGITPKRPYDPVHGLENTPDEMPDIVGLDFYRGRISPTEAVEQAMTFVLRHRPYAIGVEKAGVGDLGSHLREEFRKRGMIIPIEDLLPGGRSKYMRVMALEPTVRLRKFYLTVEAQMKEEFLEEVTRFPKAKRDDIIDSAAYIMDMKKKYGSEIIEDEDAIPRHLEKLNPISRDYWASVHRVRQEKANQSWISEYV